jgi:4-amino-4-deoxy-L-arabinose transferase-like glycosyltransferase
MKSNIKVSNIELFNRYGPVLIFFIALLIRLAYLIDVVHLPIFDVFFLDPYYYDRQARQIVSGDWFSGTSAFTMSPYYPYFLAILYACSKGSVLFAKLIQHLLGAITCGLLCRIGIRLGGTFVGVICGLVSATYGLFIFSEGTLENEFLIVFLATLSLYLLLRSEDTGKIINVILAGICVGLAAGIRANSILLIIPALFWILHGIKVDRYRILRAVCFLGFAILLMLPITIRNYIVSGDLIWSVSTGGEVFYIGTLQQGMGGYCAPPFIRPHPDSEHDDYQIKAEIESGRTLSPSEVSSYWYQQGIKNIKSSPSEYAGLLVKKFIAFCNRDEPPDNADLNFGRHYSRVLSLPLSSFIFIFPLSVLGILVSVKASKPWRLPFGFFLVYFFSVLLFYQSYRFRLPAIPFLILFSGMGFVWIYDKIRKAEFLKLIFGVVVVILCFIFSNITLPQSNYADDYHNIAVTYAQVLLEKGKPAEAVGILEDALVLYPGNQNSIQQLTDLHKAMER